MLKDLLKNKVKQEKDFEKLRQWLDEYSQDLPGFFKAFYRVMQRTETDIEAFKLLYVLKINPYFYSSLVRMEMSGLLDDEVLILFAQAEICFYGRGSTNDASAYKLYEVANDKEGFKKEVKDLCVHKCARGGHKTLQEALNNTCLNATGWGKYFHYVFLTYRCSDMDFKAFENLIKETKTYKQEIEHIIPQNAPENGSLEQYGFKDEDEFNVLKDSFGNLLVLESSLNSKARDGGPATKQGIYKESQVSYCREFAKREGFLSFGKEQIEEENEEYKQWIKEEFFKDFL